MIITADHGCDPAYTESTDHTREYVPLLVLGKKVKPVNLGTRNTFADIAATVAQMLGVSLDTPGKALPIENGQLTIIPRYDRYSYLPKTVSSRNQFANWLWRSPHRSKNPGLGTKIVRLTGRLLRQCALLFAMTRFFDTLNRLRLLTCVHKTVKSDLCLFTGRIFACYSGAAAPLAPPGEGYYCL